jgi:hypothetical protein
MIVMATENQSPADLSPVAKGFLDWAEYWYPISWKGVLVGGIITAIGACATIAFLLLQWRTTSIREEHTEWRTSSLEAQTAAAKADLGRAQADIANANKAIEQARADTARAVAETARANERTADLKLELEREIAARQPRKITPEQHTRIVEMLRPEAKGAVVVIWKAFSEEPERFAKAVESVLRDAGYDVREYKGPAIFSMGRLGQWISVRDPVWLSQRSWAGSIQNAFDSVLGVFFAATSWQDALKSVPEDVPVAIVVGAKPPDTHDWGDHPPR